MSEGVRSDVVLAPSESRQPSGGPSSPRVRGQRHLLSPEETSRRRTNFDPGRRVTQPRVCRVDPWGPQFFASVSRRAALRAAAFLIRSWLSRAT
eukprot:3397554-Alexandrium_andersonii.AAC.1